MSRTIEDVEHVIALVLHCGNLGNQWPPFPIVAGMNQGSINA